MTAEEVIRLLDQEQFQFHDEAQLQTAINSLLTLKQVCFSREVRVSDKDRIDFLLENGLGIEVKIKGALGEVTRQLHRYAQLDEIKELLLVTTKGRHMEIPRSLNGKDIHSYFVSFRRAF